MGKQVFALHPVLECMTLAQDATEWDKIVYREGGRSGDGDVQHVARRRASRRRPPAEPWEPDDAV